MECTCQHCRANLDEGDILEHFLLHLLTFQTPFLVNSNKIDSIYII